MYRAWVTGTGNPWFSQTNPVSKSRPHSREMATMTLGGKFVGYCAVVEINKLGCRLLVSGYQWFPREFDIEFRNSGGSVPVRFVGLEGNLASVERSA